MNYTNLNIFNINFTYNSYRNDIDKLILKEYT